MKYKIDAEYKIIIQSRRGWERRDGRRGEKTIQEGRREGVRERERID